MDHIYGIISQLIRHHPGRQTYWFEWCRKHWADIVGPRISDHSWPLKIERNQMLIGVDSSVWNQAIFINKKEILRQIDLITDQIQIKDIKCIVTEKISPQGTIEINTPLPEKDLITKQKQEQLHTEAVAMCAKIEDKELRVILEKITFDFLFHQRIEKGGFDVSKCES